MKDPIKPDCVEANSYGSKYFTSIKFDGIAEIGFCGLCGNSGIIDTRGRAITGAGLDVGIKTYCLCANGQAMRTSDSEEKKKEEEIQKQYENCDSWWIGFNIPLITGEDVDEDGEKIKYADLPDDEELKKLPFKIWLSGWGWDYATCVGRVMEKDAKTVREVYELVEKYINVRSWRWVPKPKDSSIKSERFPE